MFCTMVKIKSQSEIAKNYDDSIGRVPAAYKAGVQATTDWQEKASSESAESNYAAGVAEAAAAKRRQRAVQNVSNAEWQNAAVNKGSTRIATGMKEGSAKRTANFEPYRSAIEGVTLPDRTTDPIANVDNRVKPIVQVLVDTKKAIKG